MQQERLRSTLVAGLRPWLAVLLCTASQGFTATPPRLAFAPAVSVAAAGVTTTVTAVPPTPAASTALKATTATLAPASSPATAAAPAAITATTATLSMAGGTSTLHLLMNPVALPQGQPGVGYPRIRIVLGGVPGYTVSVDGSLPQGLALSADGYLGGTPTVAGFSRFTVRASDDASPPAFAHQTYTLRIANGAARVPAKPASTAASAPKPLSALTADDAKAQPAQGGTSVSAYRLSQADLDQLVPEPNKPQEQEPQAPAEPEASAGSAIAVVTSTATISDSAKAADAEAEAEAARAMQQRLMLKPLVNAEFPSRYLFEAALDAQLCKYARTLIEQAERSRGLPLSGGAGLVCPPTTSAQAPAKSASAPKAAAGTPATGTGTGTQAIPLAQLPAWLLPADLRRDLVSAAEKRYSLDAAKPPQWTDGECGCVHEDMVGETYGFYPFWAAEGQPQQINFSLLTRIAYHAATFADDGSLLQPASWKDGSADFAVQALRHGTRLDLVVWRNDWKSLLAQDETRLDRAARELARGAVQAVDTPLRDRASRWQRWLPLYASKPTMADGVTVFFDNAPAPAADPAGAQAFAGFVRKFMLALIDQMRQGKPRTYTINLALSSRQIGSAPFDYDALFDYLTRAEDPKGDNQRIQEEGDVYRSQTNVTLRFVVLLPEPTTVSKKSLRKAIEDAFHGNTRRILLRKVIATIPYNAADPQQLKDDLVFFHDNFGGAGFWQVPIAEGGAGAEMYDAIARTFRKDATQDSNIVCKMVCTNRWLVRGVSKLLLAGLLLGLVAVAATGGFRCLRRRYLVGLALMGLATAAVFFGLLQCDPELQALRQGNRPLGALGVIAAVLLLLAVYAIIKPRDPRP